MSDQITELPKLQIDQAMADLAKSSDANAEAVRELLRRIEPLLITSGIITGSITLGGTNVIGDSVGGFVISAGRAPLAFSIDKERLAIEGLTKEVQKALDALQI